ncbi:unnamed protein product [Brassicogethes aeneus]|uniref:Alpha 1,4-glycosyltransferase domain-containing protein n=1 Tax=Brassicogethes aeneus TaxID=1431903 RepID=A0A9P0FN14_BRAAE|nr:unnamed protein product [Brassicogethes aeneus]
MAFGDYPADYNPKVHGPYDPARFYGKPDTPFGQVKVGEISAWLGRRNKGPAAITGAISRESLEDISDITLPEGKKIFFHETSCNSDQTGKITINAVQACSVESAAKLNPDRAVYLLYLSSGVIKNEGSEPDRLLEALLSYNNVKIYHVDVMKYVRDTPAEVLFLKERVQRSEYQVSHASDVMRYLTLWKYGGVYLDLDVIVLKSFDELDENFSGAQLPTEIAAGVMGFGNSEIGKKYATDCLSDLVDNFDGFIWGANGPDVITRFASKLCNTEKGFDVTKTCENFTVYGPEIFYPIPYYWWYYYFDGVHKKAGQNMIKNAHVLHVWKSMNTEYKQFRTEDSSIYTDYAKLFCPNVFEQLDEYI